MVAGAHIGLFCPLCLVWGAAIGAGAGAKIGPLQPISFLSRALRLIL